MGLLVGYILTETGPKLLGLSGLPLSASQVAGTTDNVQPCQLETQSFPWDILVYWAFLCFVVCVVYVCTHAHAEPCLCMCVSEGQRLRAEVVLSHPPPFFLRQDLSASPVLRLQTHSVDLSFYVGPEALRSSCLHGDIFLTKPSTHLILFLTQHLM